MAEARSRVAVASYNVHRCIGRDGRHDPARIAAVLQELDADVVGLQEVHCRSGAAGDVDQLAYLAERGGYRFVWGPTVATERGHCGNGLLTRVPMHASRGVDLSVGGSERRGALDVDLDAGDHRLRVIVTHLGLLGRYRRAQVDILLRLLRAGASGAVVLLGDMNEWLPLAAPLRRLHGHLGRPHARRSFPARLPLFALDRIWAQPRTALSGFHVHRSALARAASDHLPVRASVTLPARADALAAVDSGTLAWVAALRARLLAPARQRRRDLTGAAPARSK